MKYIIAVLLSALLIGLAPDRTPPAHLNIKYEQAKGTEAVVNGGNTRNAGADQLQTVQAELTSKRDEISPQPQTVTTPETPKAEATAEVQQVLTDKEQLMQNAGIPQSDWNAVDYIVSHESSWRVAATNPDSYAYGLCQALPAEKMASAGPDWKDNPVTQLKWCHAYALDRYGSWWKAHAFWQVARWW